MGKGTLKLKGDDEKKKKRSSKSKELVHGDAPQRSGSVDAREVTREASGSPAPPVSSTSIATSHKTDAERRFDEVKRKRLADKAAKDALKSHKDRVAEFNTKLERLSEHYDIPKVGPG